MGPRKVHCIKISTFGDMYYFLKVGQSPDVHFGTFPKLPVHALNHDPQKNTYGHQLGPMIHFLTTSKFDPL